MDLGLWGLAQTDSILGHEERDLAAPLSAPGFVLSQLD